MADRYKHGGGTKPEMSGEHHRSEKRLSIRVKKTHDFKSSLILTKNIDMQHEPQIMSWRGTYLVWCSFRNPPQKIDDTSMNERNM